VTRGLRRALPLVFGDVILAATPASGQLTPLFVVDLSLRADAKIDFDRPLRVRLYSNAPGKLAEPLPGVQEIGPDSLVLDLEPATVLSRDAPPEPRPSFVIDYDDEAVARLSRALVSRYGPAPSDAELAAFVRESVEPSHDRNFDIASQVATHRRGDCTEHAVVLAALARSVGLPARVAVGTVLARVGDEIGAFGHAWTEIHRDGAWSLVDATPNDGASLLAYVPEGLLENESPGYSMNLTSLFVSGILRVEVLGNAPASTR